jgi:hypothetical protein
MKNFETKTQAILNHLQSQKNITSWEAIKLYKATRLSAHIFYLKEKGYNIVTVMEKNGDMRYGRYVYLGMKND